MNYQPQTFYAPDGTQMVVLPAEDFAKLKQGFGGAELRAEAKAALRDIEAGIGTMPGEVLDLILDENLTAVGAWRRYRGLSQAELARKAGLSQVFVSKIERGESHGTSKTRKALANALDAPAWALEDAGPTSKRAQNELQSLILALVMERPDLTELEIAREVKGDTGYQQQVNQECRMLVAQSLIERSGLGGRGDPFRYRASV